MTPVPLPMSVDSVEAQPGRPVTTAKADVHARRSTIELFFLIISGKPWRKTAIIRHHAAGARRTSARNRSTAPGRAPS